MDKIKKWLIAFFKYHLYILPLLVIIDLVSKYVMQSILVYEGASIKVIDGFFNFTLIYNTGSFSGFLGLSKFGTFILLLLSIAGTVGGIIYLYKKYFKMSMWMKIGLYLFIPGAAGNLVDRFLTVLDLQKGVIDFFHFYNLPLIGDFNVFNVADICLTVSIVFIIIGYIIDEKRNEKIENEEKQNG